MRQADLRLPLRYATSMPLALSQGRFGVRFGVISALCLVCFSPCSASTVRSISDDVSLLQTAWEKASLKVQRLPVRFLYAQQVLPVQVSAAAVDDGTCVSVAVLGSKTTRFVVQKKPFSDVTTAMSPRHAGDAVPGSLSDGSDDTDDSDDIASVQGGALVTLCGPDRPVMTQRFVRMLSPQGAVQVLVGWASTTAPPIESVLLDRQARINTPVIKLGSGSPVAPLSERVAYAEQAILQQGGEVKRRSIVWASSDGRTGAHATLAQGCHRFVAMAHLGEGRGVHFADLDMYYGGHDGSIEVQDDGFSTDAQVQLCTGMALRGYLYIRGVPPGGAVTVLHASWPLPEGIPPYWSPRSKAAIARAMLQRSAPRLPAAPVWQAQGSAGRTTMHLPVQPGTCYVASTAPDYGTEPQLFMAIQVGSKTFADMSSAQVEAAMVAFCVRSESFVTLRLNAVPRDIVWHAGLWKVSNISLGSMELP